MLIAGSQQLGFDPFSTIKSVAQSAYNVAQRSDVQRAAVAAAQAYAPQQYARATEYADRARGVLVPNAAVQPMQLPMQPAATAAPDSYGELAPQTAPVQKGNITTIAVVGGAAVILLLLMTRK